MDREARCHRADGPTVPPRPGAGNGIAGRTARPSDRPTGGGEGDPHEIRQDLVDPVVLGRVNPGDAGRAQAALVLGRNGENSDRDGRPGHRRTRTALAEPLVFAAGVLRAVRAVIGHRHRPSRSARPHAPPCTSHETEVHLISPREYRSTISPRGGVRFAARQARGGCRRSRRRLPRPCVTTADLAAPRTSAWSEPPSPSWARPTSCSSSWRSRSRPACAATETRRRQGPPLSCRYPPARGARIVDPSSKQWRGCHLFAPYAHAPPPSRRVLAVLDHREESCSGSRDGSPLSPGPDLQRLAQWLLWSKRRFLRISSCVRR